MFWTPQPIRTRATLQPRVPAPINKHFVSAIFSNSKLGKIFHWKGGENKKSRKTQKQNVQSNKLSLVSDSMPIAMLPTAQDSWLLTIRCILVSFYFSSLSPNRRPWVAFGNQ